MLLEDRHNSPDRRPAFMPAGERLAAPLSAGPDNHDAQYERNLIIVHTHGSQDLADFIEVRRLIAERAPEIEVFLVNNEAAHAVMRKKASRRPTLVFSPHLLQYFQPVRGKIYAGQQLSKLQQVRLLEDAGIPVPPAVYLTENTRLDPKAWGEFTILKPNTGSRGEGVRLVRTADIFPAARELGWPATPYIAQKFADTGAYPTEYRALTLFGEVLYCNRVTAQECRPDLDKELPADGRIASNSGPRASSPCNEDDILDFARRTYKAFPQVPVHGIDIIRDVHTGGLYALEVNPGGATWHLSSDHGKALQARNGFSFYDQFNAMSIVADQLIRVTRNEAE